MPGAAVALAVATDNVGLIAIAYLAPLALLLPYIAVAVRRLHDTGRSGVWFLIAFVPFGGIVLLVFLAAEGEHGPNQWGHGPAGPA